MHLSEIQLTYVHDEYKPHHVERFTFKVDVQDGNAYLYEFDQDGESYSGGPDDVPGPTEHLLNKMGFTLVER